MKKFFLFSILLLLVTCRNQEENNPVTPDPPLFQQAYQPPYFQTDSQKFIYDINALPEITVEVSLAEWNKFLNFYDQNPNNEEYVAGKFTWVKNGTTEILDNISCKFYCEFQEI